MVVVRRVVEQGRGPGVVVRDGLVSGGLPRAGGRDGLEVGEGVGWGCWTLCRDSLHFDEMIGVVVLLHLRRSCITAVVYLHSSAVPFYVNGQPTRHCFVRRRGEGGRDERMLGSQVHEGLDPIWWRCGFRFGVAIRGIAWG